MSSITTSRLSSRRTNAGLTQLPSEPTAATNATAASRAPGVERDLVVDFIRVLCMFAVVAVHLLMIGISTQGGIKVINPLTDIKAFAQGTWWGQVMPLFFVVGGFASLTSWRSVQRKNANAGTYQNAGIYLRARLLRLIRPTVALYAFLAIALWAAKLAGAPSELLTVIAAGCGVQLWFLAAYLICQMTVPVLAHFHEKSRWATVAVLAMAAIFMDAVRFTTHQDAWGLVNMIFVWALVQQIGFFYADGAFDRIPRFGLLGMAIACYLLMIPLTHLGPYPVDMLSAQNPPFAILVLVGLAHILLVKAIYPQLQWLVQRKPVQKVMFVVGTRSMSIYLWHLPLIITLFGLTLLLGLPFPDPASAGWWLSRPVYYVLAFGLVLLVTSPLIRLELASTALPKIAGRPAPMPSTAVVLLATVIAGAGPFAVMRVGLDLYNVLWGLVALVVALLMVKGFPTREQWQAAAPKAMRKLLAES